MTDNGASVPNWNLRSRSQPSVLAITVRGVVQGVGFRPFVYNLARGRGLDWLGAQ